jgi:hypothetical protein
MLWSIEHPGRDSKQLAYEFVYLRGRCYMLETPRIWHSIQHYVFLLSNVSKDLIL